MHINGLIKKFIATIAGRRERFSTDGYLGGQVSEIRRFIRHRWGQLLILAEKANRLAHKVRNTANITGEDIRQLVGLCLLIRLMEDYQAAVILCRQGLVVQAGVLLRTMLEGTVLLRSIQQDNTFLNQYVGNDLRERLKLAQLALNDRIGAFDSIKTDKLADLAASLESAIAEAGIKRFSVEELAKRVGLETVYQTTYRLLSRDVHILVRSLERYFQADAEGRVTAIDYTPKTDDLEAILVLDIMILMIALDSATAIFKLSEFEKEIEDLNNEAARWHENCAR